MIWCRGQNHFKHSVDYCKITVLHLFILLILQKIETNGQNEDVLRLSAWGMFLACSKNLGKSQPQRSSKKGSLKKECITTVAGFP